ncbi:patatin-like phospholipase family protein [Hahella sp. CCB-MM4]|uniref:patatin-like phospholipase family protein n=1 Tax=Hahella sp. (strain CCB-MM4) TaxID=1926491 RepID=UPI001FEE7B2F|nr:patatin-like phospholipase family protein [Hahella sp. CCB-MM4]
MIVGLSILMTSCSSVYKPQNEPSSPHPKAGYHLNTYSHQHNFGDTLLILSFSGGGTRAAALSYGVLQELRETYLPSKMTRRRLLDEIDMISSVSGGSFTAAYYGLYGEDIFETYEKAFLRQSIQSALIRQLLTPTYWWRSLFTAFDRTEMAIEYYDTFIFNGATFGDIPLERRPYILINATDLSAGNRFSFTQDVFDLFCSDLDKLPIARAVTASSAVPVAFPPVVMKNFAGQCDPSLSMINRPPSGDDRLQDLRLEEQRQSYLGYLKKERRPYIHLVDGGISDNLGLRTVRESFGYISQDKSVRRELSKVERVVIILVNAEVRPSTPMDLSSNKPGIAETVDAVSNTQIRHYNLETKLLLSNYGQKFMEKEGKKFYFIDVNFESFKNDSFKRFFNNLPTSLELKDSEVDSLIEGGRTLLRNSPEFKALLEELHIKQMPRSLRLESTLSPFEEGATPETLVD